MSVAPTKILILGGGFGGTYTALHLERLLSAGDDVEVTLVNRENFLLFTPMLHEVAASDLDATHIVNPLHKLLRRTKLFCGLVNDVDTEKRVVTVSHGLSHHTHELPYDHLVLALGSTSNFFGSREIESHAMTMKSLEDALKLRSRAIALLEEADFECCAPIRSELLTFVVAGSGFAGVETIAGLNDFLRHSLQHYTNLRPEHIRCVLVSSTPLPLPELSEKLGTFTKGCLTKAGIEIITGTKVKAADGRTVTLSDGTVVPARTFIWTAGTGCHPLVKAVGEQLELRRSGQQAFDRGRLIVNESLDVPGTLGLGSSGAGTAGIWALGDCAAIPDARSGKTHPPTAQHAIREAKTLARNLVAATRRQPLRPFRFRTLGQLAAIGRRDGVANILGWNFSGVLAWLMWRTIYLTKLPRWEKRVRVAIDWTLDLVFSKDLVQYLEVDPRALTADPAELSGSKRLEHPGSQALAGLSGDVVAGASSRAPL